MFATFLTLALFFAPALQGVLADFTLDTPEITQCAPAKLTWSGSTASSYNLIVVPADDVCGDPIADLGDHTGQSMTWNVSLPAGMKVVFSVEDDKGDEAWSATMTVQDSDDSSCVPAALLAQAASSTAQSSSASASSSGTKISTSATVGSGSLATVAAAGSDPSPSSDISGSLSGSGTNAASRHFSAPFLVLSAVVAIVTLSL